MDYLTILLRVLPVVQDIVTAVNALSGATGEDREALIVDIVSKVLVVAETATQRDLLDDEAVATAVREAVEAVAAAKAVIDTRPVAAA